MCSLLEEPSETDNTYTQEKRNCNGENNLQSEFELSTASRPKRIGKLEIPLPPNLEPYLVQIWPLSRTSLDHAFLIVVMSTSVTSAKRSVGRSVDQSAGARIHKKRSAKSPRRRIIFSMFRVELTIWYDTVYSSSNSDSSCSDSSDSSGSSTCTSKGLARAGSTTALASLVTEWNCLYPTGFSSGSTSSSSSSGSGSGGNNSGSSAPPSRYWQGDSYCLGSFLGDLSRNPVKGQGLMPGKDSETRGPNEKDEIYQCNPTQPLLRPICCPLSGGMCSGVGGISACTPPSALLLAEPGGTCVYVVAVDYSDRLTYRQSSQGCDGSSSAITEDSFGGAIIEASLLEILENVHGAGAGTKTDFKAASCRGRTYAPHMGVEFSVPTHVLQVQSAVRSAEFFENNVVRVFESAEQTSYFVKTIANAWGGSVFEKWERAYIPFDPCLSPQEALHHALARVSQLLHCEV